MGRGKEVCVMLGASWKEESPNSDRRDPGAREGRPRQPCITSRMGRRAD